MNRILANDACGKNSFISVCMLFSYLSVYKCLAYCFVIGYAIYKKVSFFPIA